MPCIHFHEKAMLDADPSEGYQLLVFIPVDIPYVNITFFIQWIGMIFLKPSEAFSLLVTMGNLNTTLRFSILSFKRCNVV